MNQKMKNDKICENFHRLPLIPVFVLYAAEVTSQRLCMAELYRDRMHRTVALVMYEDIIVILPVRWVIILAKSAL